MTAELWANIGLIMAAIMCSVFVILYHRLTRWQDSALGRNVMALVGVAALFLTAGIMRNLVPAMQAYTVYIRGTAYWLVAYIIARRTVLLVQAQVEERRLEREEKEETEHAEHE